MIVVGVTGSLASGKTEAANFFRKLGARVFDADLFSHEATRKRKPLYRAIVKLFGRDFLKKDGTLDRKKLATRVFSDPKSLRDLNTLIHPEVVAEAFELIRRLRSKAGVLVLDVPLLFEAKMDSAVDCVLVVAATRKNMIRRASKKGITAALARKVLARQWPLSKKIRHADMVIENNGSLNELERKVRCVYDRLKEKS